MKYAFSTLGCPDWPVERVVAEAARLGYDGVEIRGIKRVLDLSKAPEFAPGRIDATKKLFDSAGVAIVSIDASASFCWPEKARQEDSYNEAKRHADIAAAMGVGMIRVFGGFVPEGDAVERWARTVADYLKRLADETGPTGVTVALETHDSWKRASDIMPVIRMADHEFVGVVWDVAHPWTEGEAIAETAEMLGDKVVHFHIKDHTADHEQALLGEGIIPLDEAFAELTKMNYGGFVSLEWEKMWHPEIRTPRSPSPRPSSTCGTSTARCSASRNSGKSRGAFLAPLLSLEGKS